MIHSFRLKNFYSFGKEAEVSFFVNDKAPKNGGYIKDLSGIRLSKVEAVLGHNASGKTNLLKVLPFLKWLIVDSFKLDPSAGILLKPYMFGKYHGLPSELSVEFEINNQIYIYAFEINNERIIFEELKIKNKTLKRNTYKTLFYRKWDNNMKKYIFNGRNFGYAKSFENTIRSNASVIAVAVRFNHQKSMEIHKFWQNVKTNVVESGWIGDKTLPTSALQMVDAIDFFSNNSKLKAEAEKLLSKFDLGLEALEIKKGVGQQGPYLDIEGVHAFGGQRKSLSFYYESSGTQQLVILLKTILITLDNGGVAILDEIDANLHPEMVLSLIDLFLHRETNPKNAQLLFSTHSILVLNKLDKYQLIFTEKNKEGMSEIWRLDEISDVRSDENYLSKYIAGAYGAMPKIK